MYSYLSHHGIEGQEWGVRNGPPYPLDSGKGAVVKKGTKLGSVHHIITKDSNSYVALGHEQYINKFNSTKNVNSKGDKPVVTKDSKYLYAYNPNNKNDKSLYEGDFAAQKATVPGIDTDVLTAAYTYEAVKDLKVASLDESVDVFKKVYEDNKDVAVKELSDDRKIVVDYSKNALKSIDKHVEPVGYKAHQDTIKQYGNMDVANLKTDTDMKNAYLLLQNFMDHTNDPLVKKYRSEFSKNYDAMYDYNDMSTGLLSDEPLYILNPHGKVKLVDSKALSTDEIIKNLKYKKRRQ